MNRVMVIFASVFFSGAVLASEQSEAIAACERVEEARIAEFKAKGMPASAGICEGTEKSPAFFECMEKKIADGNSWTYSAAQCQSSN